MTHWWIWAFSPPARWGLLDFMLVARLLLPSPSFFSCLLPSPSSPSSSPDLICQLLIAVGLAGPHLPGLDRSGPRRTSSARSWSQWSSPDIICQLLIAVSLAGPPLPALDRSGPRRTSTGESLSVVGLAGLQPASVWALWASPDFKRALWASPGFNRRDSARCEPHRTFPDLNAQKQSHIECQRECQIECQIECQKICQIEC